MRGEPRAASTRVCGRFKQVGIMKDVFVQVEAACGAIRARFHVAPRVGIILGTGLGGLAAQVEGATVIPYGEIPHFPE